ncbi:MAG: sugar transferase [Candidatus Stahlbacteria bacterium]|nr:sugar transferase [Candidatus Stahlbacteria bacterium]
MSFYAKYGKTCLDIKVALFTLIFLSPLLLLLSIAIKLDSQGPIFFYSPRIGKAGKIFMLLKFRTMIPNKKTELLQFTPGNNQRATRLGKILRLTKLDELPAFFNVIKGEMSIVGPRPEVPKYLNSYTGKFAKILTLKPGITDPGSIKYRNEEKLLANSFNPELLYLQTILPDKLNLNLSYLNSISFKHDLLIIFNTFKAILFKR